MEIQWVNKTVPNHENLLQPLTQDSSRYPCFLAEEDLIGWGLQWHGIIQHRLPDVRKVLLPFLFLWWSAGSLLASLNSYGQAYETMGEGGPKTCPVLAIPPGTQQRWHCRGIWSDSAMPGGLELFSIKLALLWDSAVKCSTLGLKAAPVQHCCLFSRAFLTGNHSTHGAQGGESTPQRHHLGTEQERSLQPILPLCWEKLAVQTGALSSLQQVEQCLPDPSILGKRGGGHGGDSAQRSM